METANFQYIRWLIEIVTDELAKSERNQCDIENLVVALSDLTIFVEG